jgi:hypothetical protein
MPGQLSGDVRESVTESALAPHETTHNRNWNLSRKGLSIPRASEELRAIAFIRNSHDIADWGFVFFLSLSGWLGDAVFTRDASGTNSQSFS